MVCLRNMCINTLHKGDDDDDDDDDNDNNNNDNDDDNNNNNTNNTNNNNNSSVLNSRFMELLTGFRACEVIRTISFFPGTELCCVH